MRRHAEEDKGERREQGRQKELGWEFRRRSGQVTSVPSNVFQKVRSGSRKRKRQRRQEYFHFHASCRIAAECKTMSQELRSHKYYRKE